MAGQIALDPATMMLVGGGAAVEATRSLASAEACAQVELPDAWVCAKSAA
jgi:hypothetical protein